MEMQDSKGMYRTTKGYKFNHKTTQLQCECCGTMFLANRKNARFCSSGCRSQFWLNKNKKKVITLAVPSDIDEAFLEEIKSMLVNYKKAPVQGEVAPAEEVHQSQVVTFEDANVMRTFLQARGYTDYKLPLRDQGIYYDKGLTIKKIDDTFECTLIQLSA